MHDILMKVIAITVGVCLDYVFLYVGNWVKKKTKNEDIQQLLKEGREICQEAVDYTYQLFVQGIKGTDDWTELAKENAKNLAIDYIKDNVSPKFKAYLKKKGMELEEWAASQIEIAIKNSKDNNK